MTGTVITCDNIGKWLKKERVHRGISMAEVANRSGLCKSTITRIETEKQPPSLFTLEQICNAFGKRIVIIDGGTDEKRGAEIE